MKFPLDLADGELPKWLQNAVALTRPLYTSALIAIPSVGALSVGAVGFFSEPRAMAMVHASTAFLVGIPDAAYGLIGAVALGYTASKSVEAVKAPAPVGGKSPEGQQPPATAPAADPAAIDLSKE